MNAAEKTTFAMFAILFLSALSASTLGIEITIAIAGLFAVAYLVLSQEPVK